jgi:PAS domain S-box-containing protein
MRYPGSPRAAAGVCWHVVPALDFGDVFERLPEPYMLLDRSLRFVAANAAYRRATSSTLEQLLGRHIAEAFPNDERDLSNTPLRRLVASLERVRDTGVPDTLAHIVYRVRRTPDGPLEERIWSASHTPIADADGRVRYILQHTVDVTELHRLRPAQRGAAREQLEAGVLRRAEDVQATNLALEAERQHLRNLFHQAPGFVCVLRGPSLIVEMVNDAFYRLIGNRPAEGRPLAEVLPELASQGYLERLLHVLATGEAFVGRSVPVVLQRPGADAGEQVVLDIVYEPIFDGRAEPTGIFVQGYDITLQKRLEDELELLLERERAARADAESARVQAERANVLKDEFLATLSHELRTPLNAVLGWIRLARTHPLGPADTARALETIERNAAALAQLVEDVLDMSRIVTGKLRLRLAECDAADVVRRAIEIVTPAADARQVAIRVAPMPAAPMVGDADRLQQVVWNLLSNAIKYTPSGGHVDVALDASPDAVAITVRDDGDGIDAAFLPLLFDRFRQVNQAFDRKHGGLGVGLSLVRHLVEAHGGEVSAASPGLGQGSTFTVRLPTRVQGGADEAPEAPVMQAAGPDEAIRPVNVEGLRVLVVEDNADALDLLQHVLGSAGASVRGTCTAAEALEALWMDPPDVLVSDLGLPGMDGLELIRRIRAAWPRRGSDVPAIAVTAYARASDREHALEAGYQRHLAKPVRPGALLAAIAAVVDRRWTSQPPGSVGAVMTPSPPRTGATT